MSDRGGSSGNWHCSPASPGIQPKREETIARDFSRSSISNSNDAGLATEVAGGGGGGHRTAPRLCDAAREQVLCAKEPRPSTRPPAPPRKPGRAWMWNKDAVWKNPQQLLNATPKPAATVRARRRRRTTAGEKFHLTP